MARVLVIGASAHVWRTSYTAIRRLLDHGHEIIGIGARDAQVHGVNVGTEMPELEEVHTVTMYLRAALQKDYYDYIVGLKPKRLIFNPGAENPKLAKVARDHHIKVHNSCMLVMLSSGNF